MLAGVVIFARADGILDVSAAVVGLGALDLHVAVVHGPDLDVEESASRPALVRVLGDVLDGHLVKI